MTNPDDTIRVVIPLTIRKRNGRPKILPPDDVASHQARAQDPHILRALGRAWAWRQRLECGEVTTVSDIAEMERVTDRFVSRIMRLSLLSPDVIRSLVISHDSTSVSLNELIDLSYLPWAGQPGRVFSEPD